MPSTYSNSFEKISIFSKHSLASSLYNSPLARIIQNEASIMSAIPPDTILRGRSWMLDISISSLIPSLKRILDSMRILA